jgi:hypothetical protein
MSLVIQSFYLGNTQAMVAEKVPAAVALLGLNYDTENSIMYKGNDNTSGFYLEIDTSYLRIGFKYQGTETNTSIKYGAFYSSNNGVYLYYYKQEDGTVIFGFSSNDYATIYASCAKIIKLEDETINDWAYIMNSYGVNTDDSLIMCPSLWSDFIYGWSRDYNRSFNVVTLIPYIFEAENVGNFKFEKLFKASTKNSSARTQSLILNNKQYIVSSPNTDNNIMPFAILVE